MKASIEPNGIRKELLQVAVFQSDIVWESPKENYEKVERALEALADSEVDLIVLPETFSTGFTNRMSDLAEPIEGETLDFFRRIASRYDAMVMGSWLIHEDESNALRNREYMVRPCGSYDYYDKAHTFRLSHEMKLVTAGRQHVRVEWRGWRICPAVCYDLRFGTWLNNGYNPTTQQLDYDLMVVSANWPTARIGAWDTLLKARAIENLCYVVGANRTGRDGLGYDHCGHSLIVDYKGVALADGNDGTEKLITFSLSASQLEEFRRRCPFYLDFDQ